MNFTLFYLVMILIVLGIVGLFVWIFYERKRDQEEPQDRSQVLNYMTKYSHGHNKGILNRIVEYNGWIAVEFFPRDLNYIELLKDKKTIRLEPEVVFIPKENLKITQKGGFSNYVTDLEIIPIRAEDIPVGIDDDKKEYLIGLIEKSQQKIHKVDVINSWKKVNNDLSMETSGNKQLNEYINSQGELIKSIISQANINPEKKVDEK